MDTTSGDEDKELSEKQKEQFERLVKKAKELAKNGYVRQALELYQKALKIYHNEKLVNRINKMEAYLEEYGEEQDDDSEGEGDDMVHVGDKFYLFKEMFEKLYVHQTEGILWMWNLYLRKKGGILGDDMGLGKTIQVIGFLSGLFDAEKVKSVMIVLPVAVVCNWQREFEKWAPGIRIEAFHGSSKKERARAVHKIQRRSGVILTTYGMVAGPPNVEQLTQDSNGREFVWDLVILDEGHKIKNPSTKCSKGLHNIAARCRIILTGTPVQNNLKEMWSLFNFTHHGSLLGTARTFSMEFENPIIRARQRDATLGEQRLGEEMARSLQKIINPYFLRRTKAEVSQKKKLESVNETGSKHAEMPAMTRKNDLVCWVYLSETQQRIYREFIETEDVKELLNTSRSPLTALTVLKKICDHPRLLTTRQCLQLGLDMDEGLSHHDEIDEATQQQCAASRVQHLDDSTLINESGKMKFLIQLIGNLRNEGHRCLIFSQSLRQLDMIEKVLKGRDHKVARLDGTMRHLQEREDMIKKFTTNKAYSVFLLTTQVGGVGLTITAADRVVVYDPSWNPATDAQAVDRAFRIGQEKNVVVYRLITCGSVEEKIYRRQIFKDSITKLTTGDSKNPYRYFTKQDLRELFVLDDTRNSVTQQQLSELHANQRKTDTSLDAHVAFLHTLDMFGITDHDLMFSKEAKQEIEDETNDYNSGQDYINSRVSKAQELLSSECEANIQQTEATGKYLAPEVFKERVPRPYTQPTSQMWPGEQKALEESMHDLQLRSVSEGLSAQSSSYYSDNSQYEEKLRSPRSPTPPSDFQSFSKESDSVPNKYNKSQENKQNNDKYTEDSSESEENIVDDRSEESDSEEEYEVMDSSEEDEVETNDNSKNDDTNVLRSPDKTVISPIINVSNCEEPYSTPKNKRRRSVAAGLYLSGERTDVEPSPIVVREDVVISPSVKGPIVSSRRTPKKPSPLAMSPDREAFDYERFTDEATLRANSTRLFDKGFRPDMDSPDQSVVMEEDEEIQSSSSLSESNSSIMRGKRLTMTSHAGHSDDEHSKYDSPVQTKKKSRKNVIDSDDDDNNAEDDNDSDKIRETEISPIADKEISSNLRSDDELMEEEEAILNVTRERSNIQQDDDHKDSEYEGDEDDGNDLNGDQDEVEQDDGVYSQEDSEEDSDDEEDEETDDDDLSEEQQQQYFDLVMSSRQMYKSGNLKSALETVIRAMQIYRNDEKVQNYAYKLRQKLLQQV